MINGNSILNRRNFIKLASLGIFSVTFQPWSLVCDSVKKRLNVLIIICDDLNDALEGMGGHPQAKTPNIDRFIKQGLQFTNCHSNNPLCGPSRASLWTGYYPHTTGYYGWDQNNNKWRNNRIMKNCVTIFEHFANHGYGLYGTGKIFHNNQDTLPLFQDHDGSSGFGYGMSYGPYPWDGKSEWPWSVRHPSMRPPWGVSVFETFAPLSDIPHVKPDTEKGIPGAKGWFDIFEKAKCKPFRYVNELDRDLMTDELSAQWIIDRLNDKHDEPFFMTVGFIRPHSPWIVPEKYFNMFPIEEIEFKLVEDLETPSAAPPPAEKPETPPVAETPTPEPKVAETPPPEPAEEIEFKLAEEPEPPSTTPAEKPEEKKEEPGKPKEEDFQSFKDWLSGLLK